MDTSQLLINFLLFMLLPIWGIAGLADWFCHRATKIEHTSGVKETLMHSLMGIQIAIPLVLCLLYTVNVFILILCFLTWILHEVVAHADVKYASPKREISIWEMHAHNYLGTLPMYMLMTIVIINWPQFINLVTFNWQGNMSLVPVDTPHGGSAYFLGYVIFMSVVCVFPYIEENIRCIRVAIQKRSKS